MTANLVTIFCFRLVTDQDFQNICDWLPTIANVYRRLHLIHRLAIGGTPSLLWVPDLLVIAAAIFWSAYVYLSSKFPFAQDKTAITKKANDFIVTSPMAPSNKISFLKKCKEDEMWESEIEETENITVPSESDASSPTWSSSSVEMNEMLHGISLSIEFAAESKRRITSRKKRTLTTKSSILWKSLRQRIHVVRQVLVGLTPLSTFLKYYRQQKGKRKQQSLFCIVCVDNKRDIILRPCGLLCLCHGCQLEMGPVRLEKCPICFQVVTETIRIYW